MRASLREQHERTELTWRGTERRRGARHPLSGKGTISWIDADELAWCCEATFVDASSGGIGVRVAKPVDRGQTVWLQFHDGSSYCATACHVQREDDEYLVGLKVVPDRNALTPWKSNRETVQMKWLDPGGRIRNSVVTVKRRGATNVDVTAPRRVPAPGVVMLWDDEAICVGASRGCHRDGDRFKLEIELLGETYRNKLMARAEAQA